MPERTLPNLGLKAFFDLGENGWKDEMDLNLLTLSVLAQATVLSKVAAEPGSPANGDVHILDETHATHPNEIAIRDAGAWVYVEPSEGWLVYNQDETYFEQFDGAVWSQFLPGAGGLALDDLTDVDLTTDAPDDDDILTWDATAGMWVPRAPAGGSAPTESIIIAASDETTAITAGNGKVTFRMPYAFTLTAVRASVGTAPTGSTIIIDINEGGATILSTKLSIDATEKTSVTAASAAVISDAALASDAEITIDFDQVGSTIAGAGVKVTLIGHQ